MEALQRLSKYEDDSISCSPTLHAMQAHLYAKQAILKVTLETCYLVVVYSLHMSTQFLQRVMAVQRTLGLFVLPTLLSGDWTRGE